MENLTFDLPINKSNLIKVVGVGGGGSNAINYMYNQGINGVDFVVCNTDSQALQNSPVPNKIQLGVTLTEGLGAGADPERGAQAALESIDEINQMLNINTKMVFIAAGMGGGTGTGAAPIIGKLAKDLGILTVGIVTIPFQFEGKTRNVQAQDGIKKLRNNVDSLIVINNNKLRDVYGDLGFKKGFAKADEVLTKAAKGIAEVITNHYTQNIDLKDAKTVLENSGTAIMGSGSSSGDNRAKKAVELALDSPLLNDNRILGSKNVLLLIVSGEDEATIDEINTINELIQSEAGSTNIIMGLGEDINLQNEISVTIIATGFAPDLQQDIIHSEPQKIIHSLDDEQQLHHELGSGQIQMFDSSLMNRDENIERKFEDYIPTSDDIKSIETDCEIVQDEINAERKAGKLQFLLLTIGAFLTWLVGYYAPSDFMQHFIVFILSCFVGYQVIWNVSHSLHTPLMAVTNAISSIVIIGALLQMRTENDIVSILALISIFIATINIVGGFMVTKRMLSMFQRS